MPATMSLATVPAEIAITKIQAPKPRSSGFLARARIEERLGQALLRQRLVLVTAPAGYGKTSVLAHQLGELPAGVAHAWVALEEGDDLQRLLEALVAALEPYDPPWRTAPEALATTATQPGRRAAVVSELVNALDACEVPHGVIVLDDLHRVSDPEALEFLKLMLERLPTRWTLAVGTRTEPPLALPRLRALGELAEFRQLDLAFGRGEVLELVRLLGLPEERAEALWERTQGWPVGLRLALNAWQDVAPGANRLPAINRHVFDYLAAEVLDRLPEHLRRFLLRCSVLSELDAARCAALSGEPRAAALLEEIERLGLFATAIDSDELSAPLTLRLHDLFRAALLHRLEREHPEELPGLLKTAAAHEADPARSVPLLVRAGELHGAAELLLAHGHRLLTLGAGALVDRLLGLFPPDFQQRCPDWLRMQGLAAWNRWDWPAMLSAMQQAEAAAAGDPLRQAVARVYQVIATLSLDRLEPPEQHLQGFDEAALPLNARVVFLFSQAWFALQTGRLGHVGPLLHRMVDLLEQTDAHEVWYQVLPVPRFVGLPGLAGQHANGALHRYAEGLLRIAADAPTPLRGIAVVQQGWLLLWAGQLDEAEAALARARADAHWAGEPVTVRVPLKALTALLRTAQGRGDEALEEVRQRVTDLPRSGGLNTRWTALFLWGRVAVAFGRLDEWQACREQLDRVVAALGRDPLLARAVPALEACVQGQRAAEVPAWQALLEQEESIDIMGLAVEARLRLAEALLALGRRAEAAEALLPLPARIARQGGPGGALLARSALRRVAEQAWGELLPADLQAQLRRWAGLGALPLAEPPSLAKPVPAADVTAAGLTARELEILERLAAGESNKVIARSFELSPFTVKRHVANILEKLAVQSRGQAADWFRRRA